MQESLIIKMLRYFSMLLFGMAVFFGDTIAMETKDKVKRGSTEEFKVLVETAFPNEPYDRLEDKRGNFGINPEYSLNPYCLVETRPHAMPVDLLRQKALASKNGILKLAALFTVSPLDLATWFGKPIIHAEIKTFSSLPSDSLPITKAQFEILYPQLKIRLAASSFLFDDRQSLLDNNESIQQIRSLLSNAKISNRLKLLKSHSLENDEACDKLIELITQYPNIPIKNNVLRALLLSQVNTFETFPEFLRTQANNSSLEVPILLWYCENQMRKKGSCLDQVKKMQKLGRVDVALGIVKKLLETRDDFYRSIRESDEVDDLKQAVGRLQREIMKGTLVGYNLYLLEGVNIKLSMVNNALFLQGLSDKISCSLPYCYYGVLRDDIFKFSKSLIYKHWLDLGFREKINTLRICARTGNIAGLNYRFADFMEELLNASYVDYPEFLEFIKDLQNLRDEEKVKRLAIYRLDRNICKKAPRAKRLNQTKVVHTL
jgi:hypothetical protein